MWDLLVSCSVLWASLYCCSRLLSIVPACTSLQEVGISIIALLDADRKTYFNTRNIVLTTVQACSICHSTTGSLIHLFVTQMDVRDSYMNNSYFFSGRAFQCKLISLSIHYAKRNISKRLLLLFLSRWNYWWPFWTVAIWVLGICFTQAHFRWRSLWPLCFAAVISSFFSARYLGGPSADCHKTIPHVRKWVQLEKSGSIPLESGEQEYENLDPILDNFPT